MLYRLRLLHAASPKAISRRTSYLCVRLEFHPYPRLILKLFNAHRFGPPRNFTCVSAWSWVDHCSFGSTNTNLSPYSDSVSLRLRISCLTSLVLSNSLAHSSIGTPSLSLRLLVNIRFQVLFHSPPGVLFTVPSWYCPLSVAI